MLIDTHAHLNFSAYQDDGPAVAARIQAAGMKVINVGSQYTTSERAVALAAQYPGTMYAAVGLHPIHLFDAEVDEGEVHFQSRREEFDVARYRQLAQQPGVVAIGEMGIDYFHVPAGVERRLFERTQQDAFALGVSLARELSLPIILHCRGARGDESRAYLDMLGVLREVGYSRGVVHCYTADWPTAEMFLSAGFMISFTGIITYPKTVALAEVVSRVPLDRMMVETDAPYLAPQAVRGQRNEPVYVRYVAERIAQIKQLPYDEVEQATTATAQSFFKIPT
ncbi:MAG: TatD family hydrolase [Patescibacteria group bacterium]